MTLLESVKHDLFIWRENSGSHRASIPKAIYEKLLECVFQFGIEEVKRACHLSGRTIGRLISELDEYKKTRNALEEDEDIIKEHKQENLSSEKSFDKLEGKFIPVSKIRENRTNYSKNNETSFMTISYKGVQVRIDPGKIVQKIALVLDNIKKNIEIRNILEE